MRTPIELMVAFFVVATATLTSHSQSNTVWDFLKTGKIDNGTIQRVKRISQKKRRRLARQRKKK